MYNTINIHFINFPNKYIQILKQIAIIVLQTEQIKLCQLNCIIISDSDMIQLNKNYLNTNNITDVISFLLIPKLFIGEIYISKIYSQKQANCYNHTWKEELAYLMIHGVLHLCGYKDYHDVDKANMFMQQDKLFQFIKNNKIL
ncbi:MAG: rRNA maturation RNase YbeY [Endomicrobium sp.]|jgi:probable rRNA maturation factor|nr:rRNA maturation RNase YbeY [Endomicrobium sp.]